MINKYIKQHKIITSLLVLLLILVGYVAYYLTTFSPANELAISSIESTSVVNVVETSDTITFTPLNNDPQVGLIYYPGGKVDPKSFAYAANSIASNDILVVIEKMPFNLAIFDINAATKTIENYPEIDQWFLSGFSLGGTAASMYAYKHPLLFDGLILYASYTTESANLNDVLFPIISISGTSDGLATPEKINKYSDYLPNSTEFVEIEGGNHTQMALYNDGVPQSGDNQATITDLTQQEMIIKLTLEFINKYKN
ncbi:alpha/beta hydrolase [Anaerorhabdus sp.]|uniref:alpha/beta hydrolase n=1 Tax=Anaerorhabdus sp. TaxID=1872524 RepID=UPI002FC77B1F